MTDRLTWLAERQQGIGGSDVAPILGIPSYAGASSLKVYRSKTEEVRDDKETEAMYWGNVMEPHLIAEYGRRTGMQVTPNDSVVHHPDFPQLRGTVDAYVNDPEYGEGILEVKNNSFGFKWGNPDDDASVSVPRHYYVQVLHYMDVTGAPWADIAVLKNGTKFDIYHVEDNPDYRLENRARLLEWWDRHIIGEEVPAAEHEGDAHDKFPVGEPGKIMVANDTVWGIIDQMNIARGIHGSSSDDVKWLKTKLMEMMGESEVIVDEDGKKLISWKNPSPTKRVDQSKLREKYPEVYADCLTLNQNSRRFHVHLASPE